MKQENKLHSIGHKLYYDHQINAFLFCEDINEYGSVHRAPEFLLTLSDFNKKTNDIDVKWEKISKPYVVKFKARFMEFAYFTFYGRLEDYMEDYNNHWIELKRWLFSKAIESSFSNSSSQIFGYMKPATVISPNNIIDYIPAEKWREDVLRFFK